MYYIYTYISYFIYIYYIIYRVSRMNISSIWRCTFDIDLEGKRRMNASVYIICTYTYNMRFSDGVIKIAVNARCKKRKLEIFPVIPLYRSDKFLYDRFSGLGTKKIYILMKGFVATNGRQLLQTLIDDWKMTLIFCVTLQRCQWLPARSLKIVWEDFTTTLA